MLRGLPSLPFPALSISRRHLRRRGGMLCASRRISLFLRKREAREGRERCRSFAFFFSKSEIEKFCSSSLHYVFFPVFQKLFSSKASRMLLLAACCRVHATTAAAARLGASSSSWGVTAAAKAAAAAAAVRRSNSRGQSSIRSFHLAPPRPNPAASTTSRAPQLMLARRLSLSVGAAAAVTAAAAAAAAAAGAGAGAGAKAAGASSNLSASARVTSTSSSTSTPLRPPRSLSAHLKVYRQLSKARLSALVVATAAAGYVAGSPEEIDWSGLGWASAGTALCSAAANALNQAYEIKTDALMTRTMARPLPAGRITRFHAVAFAGISAAAGVSALLLGAGSREAAALGLGNVFLYAAIYTPLKQVHPSATWVGAVVGAIPPLIGWAAASSREAGKAAAKEEEEEEEEKTETTTTTLPPAAFVLAAGLYLWQLPHFMSLAWLCREDYARGGHKMLSLADATGKRTAAFFGRRCGHRISSVCDGERGGLGGPGGARCCVLGSPLQRHRQGTVPRISHAFARLDGVSVAAQGA